MRKTKEHKLTAVELALIAANFAAKGLRFEDAIAQAMGLYILCQARLRHIRKKGSHNAI